MRYDYKLVHIYVDRNQNFIFIPVGESKKWGPITIDSVSEVTFPYSDEQLEQELVASMGRCYSLLADDDLRVSSLEKHLGVKGFSKACKGRKLILFYFNAQDGYTFIPTDKVKGQGYNHLEQKKISLEKKLNKGDLATALKQAIELATTY